MARPGKAQQVPVSLKSVIEMTLAFLTEKFSHRGIEARSEIDSAPSVLGDPERLQQLFLNLFMKAVDAMPSGGELRVALASTADGKIEITVADDGPGVTQDMAETLFSGMASTKGSKGTGLGLLVVHKIVAEHGGTVFLDRESGPGAVFRVRVPRWGKVPAA